MEQVSENQTRAFLQPIAAPSILGLYAFAGSTFIVSAHLAGWYGGLDTPLYLLPFAAFGYWFIALAAITLMGTIAAAAENVALTLVLGTLTAGSAAAAVAELIGSSAGQGWAAIAGYTFMISAILAWYTASALMFEGVGRPILPVGMTKQAQQEPAVAPGAGEPGVQKGQ